MCEVFYAFREYTTKSTTCVRAVFAQNFSTTAEKRYPQARKPCAARVLGRLLSLSSKHATSAPPARAPGLDRAAREQSTESRRLLSQAGIYATQYLLSTGIMAVLQSPVGCPVHSFWLAAGRVENARLPAQPGTQLVDPARFQVFPAFLLALVVRCWQCRHAYIAPPYSTATYLPQCATGHIHQTRSPP